MDDLISRQVAIEEFGKHCYPVRYNYNSVENGMTITGIKQVLNELPSAHPIKGKWIRDGHHIRCNQCNVYMCDTDREGDKIPTLFCPNCGADMRC